jgi:serine/threonine protein kinase
MTFPSPHGEPPPRHLDRFRFAELLGTGGSSVVYAARDRALDRRVAVKLPRDDVRPLSWIRRARLLREAQALARVRHPHVVAVLDAVVADDLACVVLAPIAGAPAHGQALSPRRVAAVGLQIAAALTACHAARVVHRDVSPHNILVDRHGRATLIDFGLARALDPRPDDQPDDFLALPLSPAGRAAGTRPYAAPELLRGGSAGQAADQYGLCATLLACLAGRGAPALLRVLHRGLSEQPDERYPDMHALTLALRALA